MKSYGRVADPYRDLAVIDSRAPRFNQAVIGTLALVAVLTGAGWLLGVLALQLAVGLTFGRRWSPTWSGSPCSGPPRWPGPQARRPPRRRSAVSWRRSRSLRPRPGSAPAARRTSSAGAS